MKINSNYLKGKKFKISFDENNHPLYNKNGFILCINNLGEWEQVHDFDITVAGDGFTFRDTEELEKKYFADIGRSIDMD